MCALMKKQYGRSGYGRLHRYGKTRRQAKKPKKNEEIMTLRTCSSHDQKATRQRRILRAAAGFLTVHDSLLVPADRVEAARAIMAEEFAKAGVRAKIRAKAENELDTVSCMA
jgi:hypothetical protein